MKELTKKYLTHLTHEIIGAAIEVHKEMGPGLLEKVYEVCMIQELSLRCIKVKSQQTIPVIYKGIPLDAELRYDLLIEDCIVVELKAVMEMIPLFDAQAMSYARLLHIPKAVLINFTCTNIFHKGQKTFVNELFSALPDY
jgi:GxxExxY protein